VRFTRGRKCPVCGGSDNDRRGAGVRCHGFVSGEWVHCTREEHAGRAKFHSQSQTYGHRAKGRCPCGVEHAPDLEPSPKGNRGTVSRVHSYKDETGAIRHETVRFDHPRGFRQRRPDGRGGYHWNLDGVATILYHLPELLAADPDDPIWIAEGERDADTLMSKGLLATCNPMGASKWKPHYSETLRGRSVFIVGDNDEAGRAHVQQVARSLHGIARSVRIVPLPDLPSKDVTDYFIAGGTLEQLQDLADQAPLWSPPNGNGATGPASPRNGGGHHAVGQNGVIDYASLTDEEMGLMSAADVKPDNVRWLWRYMLARSEMALTAGEGGKGKSMFLLACAAIISRGDEWPDKSGRAPRGRTVIVSAEDDWATTLQPRLIALKADLKLITFCKARVVMERDGQKFIDLKSLQDRAYWNDILRRYPDTVFMVIDPIPSFLGRGVNDRQNAEIRSVLEPFVEEVIRPRGICLDANTHLNKTIDARSPVQRVTGSIAYVNIPRNVHVVVADPDQPGRRFLKQVKCNNAPDDLKAIAFSVCQTMVHFDGEEIETAIPIFEAEPVNIDLVAMMNAEKPRRGPAPVKSSALAEWLWKQLSPGGVLLMDLIDRGRDAGYLVRPTEKVPKPGFTALYRAGDRIPELHPGWKVVETETEAEVGLRRRTCRLWELRRGPSNGGSEFPEKNSVPT
jgi:hypothetical protein